MDFTLLEREEELCRLWESLPAPGIACTALCGERILVIARGRRNSGPGPDFRDAVLLVDGALRVGPVEMHLREADWFAHGHQHDSAYDGVVLHVLADAPAPEQLRLSMPTVSAQILVEAGGSVERKERVAMGTEEQKERGEKIEERERAGHQLSLNFLAELSWGRLLRRVTEILRDENGGGSEEAGERMRRAFLFRLFDSLGYSRNREPMKAVAGMVASMFFESSSPFDSFPVADRSTGAELRFDQVAAAIFARAGIPAGRLEKIGQAFMPDELLREILPPAIPQGELPRWDYRGRPANAPERRLWGGAKLTFDLLRHNLLEDALEGMRRGKAFTTLLRPFIVRLGGETILGRSRAEEILINALCPVALASGILRHDLPLIQGACLTYRNAPSLASNRIVREVEERFGGENLSGAFLQQGAIEYYQRVLSPDRSGYSMIAEPSSGKGESR